MLCHSRAFPDVFLTASDEGKHVKDDLAKGEHAKAEGKCAMMSMELARMMANLAEELLGEQMY